MRLDGVARELPAWASPALDVAVWIQGVLAWPVERLGDAWIHYDDLLVTGERNEALRQRVAVLPEDNPQLPEALVAREAFLTAASAFVLPVVEIDGLPVGDGTPGPIAKLFRSLYIEEARKG